MNTSTQANSKQITRVHQWISRVVIAATLVYGVPVLTQVFGGQQGVGIAYSAEKKKRRTPALRQRVFSQLSQAQKFADEKQPEKGLELLGQMERRIDQLNSYESAMVYNFKAFIHYGENHLNQAIVSFKKVLEQQPIPEALEKSTLYALAQLQMQQEQYDEAIAYAKRWAKLNDKGHDANSHGLMANAYYAKKEFKQSLLHVDKAIASQLAEGKKPGENLLVLKRATHYELKQSQKVTQVSEDLVRYYKKPKYWIELGNMYGEVGEKEKQLAVMEAAYQQGFLSKAKELKSLAQLYYLNGAPFKAGELLEKTIDKGQLEGSLKNLDFLAQAWFNAKEYEKAIPVYKKAAQVSKDGNAYAKLAELYVNMEEWKQVIKYGNKAFEKGSLKNPGNVSIALGMAHFNLKEFDESKRQFAQAKEHQKVRKMADQWMKYVSKEKTKWTQLEVELRDFEIL